MEKKNLRKRGHTCPRVADSLCCAPEGQYDTVHQLYTLIKMVKKRLQISELMILFVIKTNTYIDYKDALQHMSFLSSNWDSFVNTNINHQNRKNTKTCEDGEPSLGRLGRTNTQLYRGRQSTKSARTHRELYSMFCDNVYGTRILKRILITCMGKILKRILLTYMGKNLKKNLNNLYGKRILKRILITYMGKES